jgi:hypothetical protein
MKRNQHSACLTIVHIGCQHIRRGQMGNGVGGQRVGAQQCIRVFGDQGLVIHQLFHREWARGATTGITRELLVGSLDLAHKVRLLATEGMCQAEIHQRVVCKIKCTLLIRSRVL